MSGRLGLKIAAWALGLGLLPGANALAEETGFYSGFFGGMAVGDLGSKGELDALFFDDTPVSSSLDDSGAAYGIQVGYRWNAYLAAEIGYINLGKAEYQADIIGTPVRF